MIQLECLSIIDSFSFKPLFIEKISENSFIDMNYFINIACDSLEKISLTSLSLYYGDIIRMENYYVYAQKSHSNLFVLALIKSEIRPSDHIIKEYLNSFYNFYVMKLVSNPFYRGNILFSSPSFSSFPLYNRNQEGSEKER